MSGLKRLSSESDLQLSNKRLRPETSPNTELEREKLVRKTSIASKHLDKQEPHHPAFDKKLMPSTVNSSLRVPAVCQHIVIPDNQVSGRHFTQENKTYSENNESKAPSKTYQQPASIHGHQNKMIYTGNSLLQTPERNDKEPVSHHIHQNKTSSQNKNSSVQTPVRAKRKFPGPAGLLPKISPNSIRDNPHLTKQAVSTSPEIIQKQDDSSVILSSQSGEDVFNETAWQTLLSDLGEDGRKLMIRFSINTSLQKARKKLLPKGKVPLVMAVIESVDWQGSDASICLKDKSGRIHGTVHHSLMKEHQCDLQPGTVVVLRQVSMISPTARNHYLNVTPANVVAIYSNTTEGLRTIRNIEKNKSLNTVLQNIESYLREDVNTRRRSPPSEPKTPQVMVGQLRNSSTPNITANTQNSVRKIDTYKGKGCPVNLNLQTSHRPPNYSFQVQQRSENSGLQTPQRPPNSSFQTPQRPSEKAGFQTPVGSGVHTPQRPENSGLPRQQGSNKFKFVKTPNVFSSGRQEIHSSHVSTGNLVLDSSATGVNNNSSCSESRNDNIPSFSQSSVTPECNTTTRLRSQKHSCENSTVKQFNAIGTNSVNSNLYSTDFNSNKISTNSSSCRGLVSESSENNLTYTYSIKCGDVNNLPETLQIVPNSLGSTNTAAVSSTKNGFRFKAACLSKSPSIPDQSSPGKTNNKTLIQNPLLAGCGNPLKGVKEPPRPCFEVDSMWQDDLSDDLLSQLSDEML